MENSKQRELDLALYGLVASNTYNLQSIKDKVKLGANPNSIWRSNTVPSYPQTLLDVALSCKNKALFECLVETGANPFVAANIGRNSPAEKIIMSRYEPEDPLVPLIIRKYIELPTSSSKEIGFSLLSKALLTEDVKNFTAILEKGIQNLPEIKDIVNFQDSVTGETLLHDAIKFYPTSRKKEAVKRIIRNLAIYGASLDTADDQGTTARDLLNQLNSSDKKDITDAITTPAIPAITESAAQ